MALENGMEKGLLRALVAAGLILAVGGPAVAASCSALRAELQQISAGGSRSPEYAKWDEAHRAQSRALGLAERDFRHLGCAGAAGAPSCKGLGPKIENMRANLAKIERQRARHAGTTRSNGREAALRKALARQNCDTPREAHAPANPGIRSAPPSGGGFLSLFGIGRRNEAVTHQVAVEQDQSEPRPRSTVRFSSGDSAAIARRPSGPTYRTMCVRMCDGFFFPVSFATGEEGFGRDAAVCRSMCPGAEAELFVHRNPGETVENLVSVTGMPYGDLPNANRFRVSYVEGCGCQPSADRQTMASLIRSGDDEAASYLRDVETGTGQELRSGVTPDGLPTDDAQEAIEALQLQDPDTRTNMELGYSPVRQGPALPVLGSSSRPKPATAGTESAAAADPGMDGPSEPPAERNVRIVGPRYFVAQ